YPITALFFTSWTDSPILVVGQFNTYMAEAIHVAMYRAREGTIIPQFSVRPFSNISTVNGSFAYALNDGNIVYGTRGHINSISYSSEWVSTIVSVNWIAGITEKGLF